MYIIAKFYLEEILSNEEKNVKIARKRASQERLGHGMKRKVKNSFSHHASHRCLGGFECKGENMDQTVTVLNRAKNPP